MITSKQPKPYAESSKFWTVEGRAKLAFAVAAFSVACAIRLIPEIIAKQYPIGYDTMSSYVPAMLDWPTGHHEFNPLLGGWLVFAILGSLYSGTHIEPVMILKIVAPVSYGVLGLGEYLFARKAMIWTPKKSFLLVFVASIYFVSLRISWDLLRNTLGLAFALSALAFGQNLRSFRSVVLFSALVWLTVATHLLVATLLFGIVLATLIRKSAQSIIVLVSMIPGFVQYSFSLRWIQDAGNSFLTLNSNNPQGSYVYLYTVLIFAPLIPLAIIGAIHSKKGIPMWWLLICTAGVIGGTTPISLNSQLVTPERWALMLFIPLACYAVQGLSHFSSSKNLRFRRFRLATYAWISILIILGSTFIALPAEMALPLYGPFLPTSMLQSTVPLSDSGSVINCMDWLSNNTTPNSIFLVHNAFYGWAREYFDVRAQLLVFPPNTTLTQALQFALQEHYSSIYTVWWTQTYGWYGEPSVPTGFVLQHQSGHIGIFFYQP
jgi:hypothetical protein